MGTGIAPLAYRASAYRAGDPEPGTRRRSAVSAGRIGPLMNTATLLADRHRLAGAANDFIFQSL
jgi:hypothetical protein